MATSKKSIGKKSKGQQSSQAATPVNRSAKQANAKARKTRDTSGHGYEQPLANYDPITQSWKMCQVILLSGEPKLLERLPKSGMTQSGVLYQQPDWVPIISEKESSSWPTPRANSAMAATITPESVWNKKRFPNLETVVGQRLWPTPTTQETEHPDATWNEQNRRVSSKGSTHSMNLADAVKRWPTPTASDHIERKSTQQTPNSRHSLNSPDAVKRWPTPTTQEAKQSFAKNTQYQSLTKAVKASPTTGKLNPTWVEWLMGFPTGWTDLED
jgi:DNA (cytosine-5)-methyltransferase 1